MDLVLVDLVVSDELDDGGQDVVDVVQEDSATNRVGVHEEHDEGGESEGNNADDVHEDAVSGSNDGHDFS